MKINKYRNPRNYLQLNYFFLKITNFFLRIIVSSSWSNFFLFMKSCFNLSPIKDPSSVGVFVLIRFSQWALEMEEALPSHPRSPDVYIYIYIFLSFSLYLNIYIFYSKCNFLFFSISFFCIFIFSLQKQEFTVGKSPFIYWLCQFIDFHFVFFSSILWVGCGVGGVEVSRNWNSHQCIYI